VFNVTTEGHKNGQGEVALSPHEEIPFEVYKREQARISRRKLYPGTIFYSLYAGIIFVLAFRSPHPWIAGLFVAAAVPVWTLVEFFFHRYVLHGRFGPGKGILRRFLHERLDPLHWDHHDRPYDGRHINGAIGDLLGLFAVSAPLSFIAPIYTLPVLLAAVVLSYVAEEWIHHSTHFYDLRGPYFRYIKRHHGYHHTPAGTELGYGLTNGFWDWLFNTDYPEKVDRVLYGVRWTLSPVRQKIRPLYELDKQLVPLLLSEAKSHPLAIERAIDAALADPRVTDIAWRFGKAREIVSQALARFKEYGLIALTENELTIPHEERIRAYISG
jgi:4-hydroxysphinganine ceramide fatty acyl 2-hydroxylase